MPKTLLGLLWLLEDCQGCPLIIWRTPTSLQTLGYSLGGSETTQAKNGDRQVLLQSVCRRVGIFRANYRRLWQYTRNESNRKNIVIAPVFETDFT